MNILHVHPIAEWGGLIAKLNVVRRDFSVSGGLKKVFLSFTQEAERKKI